MTLSLRSPLLPIKQRMLRSSFAASSAAAFAPDDDPALVRWWDPGLSTYSGGTLEDLTGNADLTQGNASFQPALNATGINGQPSLTFDGTDDHLFNSTPVMASLSQMTVIVIAKAASQADGRIVAEGSTTDDDPMFVPVRSGSASRQSGSSALVRNDTGTITFQDSNGPIVFDDTPKFFGTMIDTTAQTITHFDDIEIDKPDSYTPSGTVTIDRFTLGALVRSAVQFHFDGEIGPVLIYNRVMTSSELLQIRSYFVSRGYLAPYQADGVVSAIPDGYTLAYNEDFTTYGDISEVIEDGQAATTGKPFTDSFVTFGVRFLVGNNDRTYKAIGSNTGTGAATLSSLIGVDPHALSNNNLILSMGEIPSGNRSDFQNLEHGGGMISSERDFAHGPGFFEVRARQLHNTPGSHIAIWLLTQNTNPHELEIDMVEIIGNNTFTDDKPVNTFFYNGHDQQVGGREAPQTQEPVSNFTLNQWQTYGFLYEADRFRWYRNGALVRDEAAYFDGTSPLYFLITWESNFDDVDDFPGPADGNNPTYPAQIEIDYLRVYAPPAGNSGFSSGFSSGFN